MLVYSTVPTQQLNVDFCRADVRPGDSQSVEILYEIHRNDKYGEIRHLTYSPRLSPCGANVQAKVLLPLILWKFTWITESKNNFPILETWNVSDHYETALEWSRRRVPADSFRQLELKNSFFQVVLEIRAIRVLPRHRCVMCGNLTPEPCCGVWGGWTPVPWGAWGGWSPVPLEHSNSKFALLKVTSFPGPYTSLKRTWKRRWRLKLHLGTVTCVKKWSHSRLEATRNTWVSASSVHGIRSTIQPRAGASNGWI